MQTNDLFVWKNTTNKDSEQKILCFMVEIVFVMIFIKYKVEFFTYINMNL